jgi:hypothetical protein
MEVETFTQAVKEPSVAKVDDLLDPAAYILPANPPERKEMINRIIKVEI